MAYISMAAQLAVLSWLPSVAEIEVEVDDGDVDAR